MAFILEGSDFDVAVFETVWCQTERASQLKQRTDAEAELLLRLEQAELCASAAAEAKLRASATVCRVRMPMLMMDGRGFPIRAAQLVISSWRVYKSKALQTRLHCQAKAPRHDECAVRNGVHHITPLSVLLYGWWLKLCMRRAGGREGGRGVPAAGQPEGRPVQAGGLQARE